MPRAQGSARVAPAQRGRVRGGGQLIHRQNCAFTDRKYWRGAPRSRVSDVPFTSLLEKPPEPIVLMYFLSVALVTSAWMVTRSITLRPRRRRPAPAFTMT